MEMIHLRRFDEKKAAEKPTVEKDQEMPFDIESMEDESIGFKSEIEELSDKDLNDLKAGITGGEVVGLSKIKKFEDFTVDIYLSKDSICDTCECNPCECAPICCPCCECEPCECPEGCQDCNCAE